MRRDWLTVTHPASVSTGFRSGLPASGADHVPADGGGPPAGGHDLTRLSLTKAVKVATTWDCKAKS